MDAHKATLLFLVLFGTTTPASANLGRLEGDWIFKAPFGTSAVRFFPLADTPTLPFGISDVRYGEVLDTGAKITAGEFHIPIAGRWRVDVVEKGPDHCLAYLLKRPKAHFMRGTVVIMTPSCEEVLSPYYSFTARRIPVR